MSLIVVDDEPKIVRKPAKTFLASIPPQPTSDSHKHVHLHLPIRGHRRVKSTGDAFPPDQKSSNSHILGKFKNGANSAPSLPTAEDQTRLEKVDAQKKLLYIEISRGMRSLTRGLEIKARLQGLRQWDMCFLGSDAVDWMIKHGYAKTREEAVEIGQQMISQKIFHHVSDSEPFTDSGNFYRFYAHEVVEPNVVTKLQIKAQQKQMRDAHKAEKDKEKEEKKEKKEKEKKKKEKEKEKEKKNKIERRKSLGVAIDTIRYVANIPHLVFSDHSDKLSAEEITSLKSLQFLSDATLAGPEIQALEAIENSHNEEDDSDNNYNNNTNIQNNHHHDNTDDDNKNNNDENCENKSENNENNIDNIDSSNSSSDNIHEDNSNNEHDYDSDNNNNNNHNHNNNHNNNDNNNESDDESDKDENEKNEINDKNDKNASMKEIVPLASGMLTQSCNLVHDEEEEPGDTQKFAIDSHYIWGYHKVEELEVKQMVALSTINTLHKGNWEGLEGHRYLVGIDGTDASERAFQAVLQDVRPGLDFVFCVAIREKKIPDRLALHARISEERAKWEFDLWRVARKILRPCHKELTRLKVDHSVLCPKGKDARKLLAKLVKQFQIHILVLGKHSKNEKSKLSNNQGHFRKTTSFLSKKVNCDVRIYE